jgi:hypothetical protein
MDAATQPLAGGFQMPRSCISRTCRSITSLVLGIRPEFDDEAGI